MSRLSRELKERRPVPILSDSASIVSESLGLTIDREREKPEESVLSQVRDAKTYPALYYLQEQYERIRLYRNWSFGPAAELRRKPEYARSLRFSE